MLLQMHSLTTLSKLELNWTEVEIKGSVLKLFESIDVRDKEGIAKQMHQSAPICTHKEVFPVDQGQGE